MINVDFYSYEGTPNHLSSKLTKIYSFEGIFQTPFDRLSPTFKLQAKTTTQLNNLTKGEVNYARINGCWYFISGREADSHRIITMNLHMDVLKTHIESASGLEVMRERSSEPTNSYLNDNALQITTKNTITDYNFPVKFSDKEEDSVYLMITAQSGYTIAGDV